MVDSGDGSAAPRKRRHQLRYAIVALLCIGAVAWMLVLMQRNVVFYKTVSEAVADRAHDGTRSMRIGGAVLPGSIHDTADGADFKLTQGGKTMLIVHHGNQPALFQSCAPVVVDGHWSGTTFLSQQILIKHGNKYEPPAHAKTRCPSDPFGNGQ
jgi:cytochrome c-type biogenesis protein CcmE